MKVDPKLVSARKVAALFKKHTSEEIAEAFIFPIVESPEEQAASAAALQEARQRNQANINSETRLELNLRSLRYTIEDFNNGEWTGNAFSFGYFLKTYISLLNVKRKTFADDISIDPTLLSMLINNKRTPPEYMFFRLEIHSNNAIPADYWYKAAEKQKEQHIKTDKQSRKKQQAFVRNRLSVTL